MEIETTKSVSRWKYWHALAVPIVGIFLMGVLSGYMDAAGIKGFARAAGPVGILVATIAATLGIVMAARQNHVAWSKRQRLYAFSLISSAAVGGIIGGWSIIANGSGPVLSATASLSPSFAIGAAALWVVGLLISCTAYHRAIDDHEERAWLWAGLAGWYAFVVPFPVWYLLDRANLVPPVDAMLLFALSLIVNAVVWLWLKFR